MREQGLAWLIKTRTVVGNDWVTEQLGMGRASNVSRGVASFASPANPERSKIRKALHTCKD